MHTITVETARFGTVDVDPESIVEFPAGLIGLGGRRYFLHSHGEESAFTWLQSLDDAELALPVTNPWAFFADYEVRLSDEDVARIQADRVDVWVTVRALGQASDFSANLRAPILIANGLGHQVINEAPDAPVRAPLFVAEPAEQAA